MRLFPFAVLLAGIFPLTSAFAQKPAANHLIKETSPYLQQHAHNPVDWYPWGEEALAKAKKEKKLILLSVGYSTCHWCHVMERECFENQEIAKVANARYVCIKVDREERPDLDRVYMLYLMAANGSGGWPMTVWLTPDLQPIFGGTYFPPKDTGDRPGFLTLLTKVDELWAKDGEKIAGEAAEGFQGLRTFAEGPARISPIPRVQAVEGAVAAILKRADSQYGGFGEQTKFPEHSKLFFLLQHASFQAENPAETPAWKHAKHTLTQIAQGGMRDHVGGGFHRYTVDNKWRVPHFEKMLYDQAQLAQAYLSLRQTDPNPLWPRMVRQTLGYVRRDLTAPNGGFYSAEDADSLPVAGAKHKVEGAFYLWSRDEIQKALGDRAGAFARFYHVEDQGNLPPEADHHGTMKGWNHLYLAADEKGSTAEEDLAKLFAIREQRPRPARDEKVLTAWNGLMIGAFAQSFTLLGDDQDRISGVRAAEFLQKNLWNAETGALSRSWKGERSPVPGFAEDYALLIAGLIKLYEATWETRWLDWAVKLQEKQDALFWDEKTGGYFSTEAKADVPIRMKSVDDHAEPSANSVAIMNLLHLSALFDHKEWREKAGKTLAAFAAAHQSDPESLAFYSAALERWHTPEKHIVIAGETAAADTKELVAQSAQYSGHAVKVLLGDEASRAFFHARLPFYASLTASHGKATAYVCRRYACELPTSDPKKLAELLRKKPEKPAVP